MTFLQSVQSQDFQVLTECLLETFLFCLGLTTHHLGIDFYLYYSEICRPNSRSLNQVPMTSVIIVLSICSNSILLFQLFI